MVSQEFVNNHPNWGCLKSFMNVPFSDQPGLDYTMSRLIKKKGSVARRKTRPQYLSSFPFLFPLIFNFAEQIIKKLAIFFDFVLLSLLRKKQFPIICSN